MGYEVQSSTIIFTDSLGYSRDSPYIARLAQRFGEIINFWQRIENLPKIDLEFKYIEAPNQDMGSENCLLYRQSLCSFINNLFSLN